MTTAPTTRPSLLGLAQRGALMLIAFIAVISSPRIMLLEVEPLANIPLEFRAVTLSLPDFALIALILITVLRLVVENGYAERLLRTGRDLLWQGLIVWIALVAWMAVSSAWSPFAIMTRYVTIHAAVGVLMALILADLMRHEGTQSLLWGLVISAVLQAVIGIAQSLNGNPLGLGTLGELPRFSYDTDRFFRAAGLSQHPNYLGGYLMVSLFACLLLSWRHWQQPRWRGLSLALAAVISIGLIATLSRSAILGTAVGLLPLAIILLHSLDAARRRLIISGGIALAVIGIALVLIATRGDIVTRFFTGREFFFDDSWREIQLNPILGTGAGALTLSIDKRGASLPNVLPVHNVYLYPWAEAGIVAMVLFVLACLAILRGIGRNTTVLLWGSAFLAVSVTMLLDNYWWAIHPFQIVFFWIIGYWWGERKSST